MPNNSIPDTNHKIPTSEQDQTDQSPTIINTLTMLNDLTTLTVNLNTAEEFGIKMEEMEEKVSYVDKLLLPQENINLQTYWELLIDLAEKAFYTHLTEGSHHQSSFRCSMRTKVLATLGKMDSQDWEIGDDDIPSEYIERLFNLLVHLKSVTYLKPREFSFLTPIAPHFLEILEKKLEDPDNKHNENQYKQLVDPLIGNS